MSFSSLQPPRSPGSTDSPAGENAPGGRLPTVNQHSTDVARASDTQRTAGAIRASALRWQRALYVPLTVLAWLALLIIFGWLIGHVAHTVIMIVLATILTIALQPLVALFKRRLSRPLAVAGAYLAGLAVVLGLGLLLIMTAAQQVVALVQNLPAYAQRVQVLEPQLLLALRPLGVTGASLQSLNQQVLTAAQAIGGTLAAGSLGIVSSIASDLVDAVLILMLSIYFMLSGPSVVAWLQECTPGNLRAPARFLVQIVSQVVGGYVRGTLTMALLIGMLVGLGLGVLGVPYAVLLGVLAFFMEFIPVVGVLISGAVSLIVTLPSGPFQVIVVLIYFVVVHIIESDVVGPRVMGRAVGIHPATGIIALLAGSELFGVWGALFASPLAGLLQATVTVIWRGLTMGDQPNILASVAEATEATVEANEAADAAGAAAEAARASARAESAAGAASSAGAAKQAATKARHAARDAADRARDATAAAADRASEAADAVNDAPAEPARTERRAP